MQNKTGDKIILILKYALFMLLCVQIVTGCVWCILNFAHLSPFPETFSMMKMSSTLRLRNNTGILYPSLLLTVRALTLNAGLPFYEVMYAFQLLLAFVSWYVFATASLGIAKKKLRIFFALSAVTFPMAMQCHLAVLEHSFVSSLLCLLIAFSVGFSREWKGASKGYSLNKALLDVSVVCLFWLLLALTSREFILIGLIPVLFFLIPVCRKTEYKFNIAKLFPAGIAAVFLAIILLSDSLFASEDHNLLSSIKRSMYYRTAWSVNLSDRNRWPEELTSLVDEDVMYTVRDNPALVREDLRYALEGELGPKAAADFLGSLAYDAFRYNKKRIVKQTVTDIAGYLFPAVMTECILKGDAMPGYVTGNLDVMSRYTPALSFYYLRGFAVLSVIGVIFSVIGTALSGKECMAKTLRNAKFFIPTVILSAACAGYCAFMGDNIWDYKRAVFVSCLWLSYAAAFCINVFDGKETG